MTTMVNHQKGDPRDNVLCQQFLFVRTQKASHIWLPLDAVGFAPRETTRRQGTWAATPVLRLGVVLVQAPEMQQPIRQSFAGQSF